MATTLLDELCPYTYTGSECTGTFKASTSTIKHVCSDTVNAEWYLHIQVN